MEETKELTETFKAKYDSIFEAVEEFYKEN